MRSLIKKELISLFCSGIGLIFALVFLIVCGFLLWFFEGSYNILDAGYATLDNYFSLAPILLIILIPSLTMRLIAEEKRSKTLNLLLSRPLSVSTIWFSKWIATFAFISLVIFSTIIYVYLLYILGNPVGNIDLNVVFVSYISLLLLSGVFIGIGILASAVTSNQIIAFIVAMFLNFVVFYGVNMLSGLFLGGNIQIGINMFGLLYHYQQIQRGVIDVSDISIFVIYFLITWICSIVILSPTSKQIRVETMVAIVSILGLFIFVFILQDLRLDVTKDKRYTLAEYSKNLMQDIAKDDNTKIKINIYLNGNLNTGFQRLSNSASDLLSDMNRYADNKIEIVQIDPMSLPVPQQQLPEYMAKHNMPGTVLNERDRNGKISQQIIYPYTELISQGDTLQVFLLKNTQGNTAEENLNASSEDLEFQFVDGLRLLLNNEGQDIAFIEGHGELPRAYVYDAEETLAKYYNVNRGEIGNDVSILNNFKVIIIAGATKKFTETEKFILDQYLMRGGNILWLLDGVYLSHDDLANNGYSASMKNETNLDDLLFNYGVRIQSVLLQDTQSSSIVINNGKDSQPLTVPWYYSPLLLPSPNSAITKYISNVKAEFVSSINVLSENSSGTKSAVLLTTSDHTHIVQVPEPINFDVSKIQSTENYFNESYIPVSASLEGSFKSAFENRSIPDSIVLPKDYKTLVSSENARMIVVASSDIIRNNVVGEGDDTQIIPMGFDYISGRQYGNKNFIVNAVNWLADGGKTMTLRNKTRLLSLLNKQLIYENRNSYVLISTLFPILFILIIISIIYIRRRNKYGR